MLKKSHVDIESEALDDIQEATDYYNQRTNMGKQFFKTIENHIEFLKKNYLAFAIK